MTIKTKLLKLFALVLVAIAGVGIHAINQYGQATTTQTILSSAITSGASSLRVAAATVTTTQFYPGNIIYIDKEAMVIQNSYSSGTTIPIQRGQMGTIAASHLSSAVVFVGSPAYFIGARAAEPSGSCTQATASQNYPLIAVSTGNLWYCNSTSFWESVNLNPGSYGTPYRGTTGTQTGLLTDELVVYTSLAGAAPTYTLPAVTGIYGKRIMVTSSVTPATTNITVTTQGGTNIGPSSGTSITLSTAGAIAKVISIGGSWLTY